MNVTLSQELEQLVRREVDKGRYNSVDEVVEQALRLLFDHGCSLEELRGKIDSGFAQAEAGQLLAPDEARAFLQARHEQRVRDLEASEVGRALSSSPAGRR